MKGILGLLKSAVSDFVEDECTRMAAALSYYTVFALPPLLILLLLIVGTFVDPQEVQRALTSQASSLVGADGAGQIREIIAHTREEKPIGSGGIIGTVLGLLALLFGATGAFAELQGALNRVWEVQPDPQRGGVKNFLGKRLLSLGMVLTIAFLLLVSLALSALLSALGDMLSTLLGGGTSGALLQVLNHIISFVAIALLFSAIFKIVPDGVIAWRDVWVGAIATALLFELGKFGIGLYLGKSEPGSAFGAAGSLAVILIWIYYSSIILLFGAEFTQVWATERGGGIRPEEGAVRVGGRTTVQSP